MTPPTPRPGPRWAHHAWPDLPLPVRSLAGFAMALVAVTLIAVLSWWSLKARSDSAQLVTRTLEVLQQIDRLQSMLSDAETGQRGYLLTRDEAYLEPYLSADAALPGQLATLRTLTAADAAQQQRVDALGQLVGQKLAELKQTIALRSSGDAGGALAVMQSGRGTVVMSRIRDLIGELREDERTELDRRQQDWRDMSWLTSLVSWGGSGLLLVLILGAAWLASRDYRTQRDAAWLEAGELELAQRLQGDQDLARLAERVLAFLVTYLDALVGALYVARGERGFVRSAVHGLDDAAAPTSLAAGEGLLGQVAKDALPRCVTDVPPGHFGIVSASGRSAPAALLLAPASMQGVVHAVVELGFLRTPRAADRELLRRASESLAIAVRASQDRSRLEQLLAETQRQGEELQVQQEELRVSNEELEAQTRVLQRSQAQLESQQAELEQTNAQLEEQANLLENQRDALAAAHAELSGKAEELERSNQHKSEFLANMSHELRTPLNSTLILSKLLADNKDGNLSAEQVKFAQTIWSAGNDLLYLINDVLDLAKIEAGKVDVAHDTVSVPRLLETLAKSMRPLAEQKALAFSCALEPGAPERLRSDGQRLGQILRNLVSNAIKFTAAGSVTVRVAAHGDTALSFAVGDTGIGIAPEQHGVIFEAFRQADGSTHRRFGGTGLGLSISRDLARLLGGDITLRSAPGQGSCFTMTLPLQPPPSAAAAGDAAAAAVVAPAAPVAAAPAPVAAQGLDGLAAPALEDDRALLQAGARVILVVEDDPRFAAILRDLAREMGFLCVLTHNAADGLHAAAACRPSAILLDMNLPDESGLVVLDRLKRNPSTRHIPVHVASVADHAQEALELGAVGYVLKPVRREQLVDALRRLEAKFTQRVRSVLVIEDDARQRESIGQLLATGDVRITMVDRAVDALTRLRETTFDCVVMDLNLPDLSGYELLEKMAEQDAVSFPPVIVYTGRALTPAEEQRLRRFSKSIIVKDARSPERLLDEVTLFLHQVEAELPAESQRLLKSVRERDAALEGRRVLVVEDDVRNIFALSKVLEPKGIVVEIARNGREAIDALEASLQRPAGPIHLVLMDIMMPEMDGLAAMREIRKRSEWKKLPIIALTAKAMADDHERCIAAGASDYIAKPLDVEKLLSLVRVWMPK